MQITDVDLDDPGPGQVRVKLAATGLCRSDLAQDCRRALSNAGCPGGEGARIVESVGAGVSLVTPGDKVLLPFSYCGECAPCAAGNPAYCVDRFPLDLAGASRGPQSGEVRRGGEVIQSHLMGRSAFADYSIAIGGTVLICGVAQPGTMLPVEMNGFINGKTLTGVTLGDAQPTVVIEQLIGHIPSGAFPVEELQKRYSLDAIPEAENDMLTGVTVKPVIVF